MLRVNPKCVAVAYNCCKVLIVNELTWCWWQFANVKQSVLFCSNLKDNHKES
jgi:hypothetical protein